jgi:hypothetical protein
MLEFLIGVAWKVYAIFGYLWQKVVDAANYAWTWAKNEASLALQAAKDFAWKYIELAKDWAWSWINWLQYSVPVWIQAAKDWAYGVIINVQSWAWGWIDYLRNNVPIWIQAAKDWAYGVIINVQSWAWGWIDWLRGGLDYVWSTINPWSYLINSLIDLLSAENMTRLSQLLTNLFPTLLSFVFTPIAWLYSTISGTFVTFFCWIIASMMGTVKYTLPPPPDWLTGSGGPYTPGPPGPGPSEGELAPPLDRLWISGYHFGPGHQGLDLGLAGGDPVYAMHDGEVEVAGWSSVGYGYTITIRNGKWWTRYAHLASLGVGVGDPVKQRDKIAQGDTTGNSSGNHLHLEIKQNGVFIDPEPILF